LASFMHFGLALRPLTAACITGEPDASSPD
jgi:hypothetical protein